MRINYTHPEAVAKMRIDRIILQNWDEIQVEAGFSIEWEQEIGCDGSASILFGSSPFVVALGLN